MNQESGALLLSGLLSLCSAFWMGTAFLVMAAIPPHWLPSNGLSLRAGSDFASRFFSWDVIHVFMALSWVAFLSLGLLLCLTGYLRVKLSKLS